MPRTTCTPPLYFALLRGWIGLFGDGIFSVRCMSALPGVAAVGLGIWLTRQIATRRAAVLAGVLLAILPTAVRYSQEVRMYSLLGLWLLGATIALVYWVRQPQRTRYLVAYVLLMTAAFYTHYFTALCVLAHWSWLALLRLPQASGERLVTRAAWWWANVAIVLFIPALAAGTAGPGAARPNNSRWAATFGWEAPVNLYSVPTMIWQFLIQDEGDHLWRPLFVGLPLALIALVGVTAWHDRRPVSVRLAAGAVFPVAAVAGLRGVVYFPGVHRALPSRPMPWACPSSWRWP